MKFWQNALVLTGLFVGTVIVAWLMRNYTVLTLAAWAVVGPLVAWHMGIEKGKELER